MDAASGGITNKRARSGWFILGAAAAPLVVIIAWLYFASRQDSLDRQLAQAVVDRQNDQAITLLADGADPNCDVFGWQDLALTHRLLRLINPVELHHRSGFTPLLIACGFDDHVSIWTPGFHRSTDPNWPSARLVHALLRYGADVGHGSNSGVRAAEAALYRGGCDTVSELAAGGVDLNHLDAYGHSALMFAALYDDTDMIERLVHLGANVNQQDSAGFTALTFCMHYTPTLRTANALLAAGIDPNIKTYSGDDALAMCRKTVDRQIAHLLILHGALKSANARSGGAPAIATLLGVTIGKDDLAFAARQIHSVQTPGPAAISVPRFLRSGAGAETWNSLSTGGYLDLNTIDWPSTKRTLMLAYWLSNRQMKLPAMTAATQKLCWMGGIRPGMSRREVETITSKTLPPPERQGNNWSWYMPGYVAPVAGEGFEFTRWSAILTFDNDTVNQITVMASQ